MPAVTILRLPRVSRAAIVGSGTRKSRAMSAVVTPDDEPQRERAGDLGGQRRVAAHQHEAQHGRRRRGHRGRPYRAAAAVACGVDDQQGPACAPPSPRRAAGRAPAAGPRSSARPRAGPGCRRAARCAPRPRRHPPARPRRGRADGTARGGGRPGGPTPRAPSGRERLVRRHCGSYPSILMTGRISTVYAGGSSRRRRDRRVEVGQLDVVVAADLLGELGERAVGDGARAVGVGRSVVAVSASPSAALPRCAPCSST